MVGHTKSMWAIRGQLIISTFTTGCSEKPCPKKYSFFCSGIYRSLLALKQAMNQALKLMGKQVAILEGPSRWNRVPRREVFHITFCVWLIDTVCTITVRTYAYLVALI